MVFEPSLLLNVTAPLRHCSSYARAGSELTADANGKSSAIDTKLRHLNKNSEYILFKHL